MIKLKAPFGSSTTEVYFHPIQLVTEFLLVTMVALGAEPGLLDNGVNYLRPSTVWYDTRQKELFESSLGQYIWDQI